MQYQVTSDNIQLSESMKVLVREKFERVKSRLKNFPDDSKSVRVVLNSAKDGKFEVRANVKASKFDYYSDELEYSLEGAIIKTVEELLRMMERDKEKWERWERDIRDAKRFEEEQAEIVEKL